MSTQPVKADPSDDYPSNLAPPVPQDSVTDPWGFYNRECTSFVAWRLNNNNGIPFKNNDYKVKGTHFGDAYNWGSVASAIQITVNTTPAIGAVAWWYWPATKTTPVSGHVAWVTAINADRSVQVQDYNWNYDGKFLDHTLTSAPTGYIHFNDISGSNEPSPTNNTVLAVKKLTQSDGTNEVFWAKNTDVFESWWRGGSGIHLGNIIHISQGDIVDIDAQMLGNEHLIYTATNHWIYETWWYPGGALHTAAIVNSSSNVRHIQKTIGSDGVTHQLYVLTDTGASEYWWNSGSNGVQGGSLYNLRNPVAMQKFMEPGGTQVLFVADQNYAYMVRWGGGLSGIQVSTIIDVSGITSLSFSEDSDGKHRLYVGTSSGGIWEASWYAGGGIGYWYMTGGGSAVALQKWESDSTQVLYEATAGGVFEYWWPTNSNLLHAFTIVGGLSSVHAFVRSTDPNGVQSVYTATGTNVLESWWIPGGDGIHTGTIA